MWNCTRIFNIKKNRYVNQFRMYSRWWRFIVLVITIIMVITKEKIKLGINCAIFGLSFVIGSTWIKNIELFWIWKQNYDYILCGLGEAIIIPVIFGGLGIILYYYHKEGILSLILSGLPVMYCSFTLISYQWENQFC